MLVLNRWLTPSEAILQRSYRSYAAVIALTIIVQLTIQLLKTGVD